MDKNECNSNELQYQLHDTKNFMKQEIDRFHKSEQVLGESGNTLLQADVAYKEYENKLEENISRFLQFKKKAERDNFYLWYSFYILIIVCLYIFIRRLGIIHLLIVKPLCIIFNIINRFRDHDQTNNEL